MSSAAIVTTLKYQGPSLITFVEYHLAIGFERIYLMFDDPMDPDQDLVAAIPGVKVLPVDEGIKAQWQSLYKYKQYGPHINTEVRARQTLNAELALNMALQEGIEWILHIDSDELLWLSQSTIHTHLERLAEQEIICASYMNYEAVPDKEEVSNYFLEVTAFKKPRRLLEKQGVDVNALWQLPRKYFNFYNNGKSMCRVRQDMVPHDVHKWRSRSEHISTARYFHPAILHYACCGYDSFKSKFEKLINTGNKAEEFGVSMKDKGFTVDYDATMAYLQHDESRAREIYRNQVMLDTESIESYITAGVMERIDISSRLKTDE